MKQEEDKIVVLLKKFKDPKATKEEKRVALEAINASIKEFNSLLKKLILEIKNELH